MGALINIARKAEEIIGMFTNRTEPEKFGGSWFFPLNSKAVWNEVNFLESFFCVPELNAIINLKGRCHANGRRKIVNKQGKLIVSHRYKSLLRKPNWFQGEPEFIRQTTLFHEIYGNEYIYSLFPVGFEPTDEKIKAQFTLPPNLVDCEYTEKQAFFTFSEKPDGVKYILDFDGKKVALDGKTITHLNENRVNITKINDKHLLKGESRMVGLKPNINNIRAAYESRGIIIRYRGAQGIVSPEGTDKIGAMPMSQDDKNVITAAYKSYGTMKDQSQVIITSVPTKFSPMTVNDPRKLGLFEECEEDYYKMLDTYGLPPDLFARTKQSTFANKNEARKDIYENTIMPEADERDMALNQTMMADDSAKIITDFSHLPVFQEDLKFKAETRSKTADYLSALFQDQAISHEEYREELFKIGIGDGKAIKQKEESSNQNDNNNEQEE